MKITATLASYRVQQLARFGTRPRIVCDLLSVHIGNRSRTATAIGEGTSVFELVCKPWQGRLIHYLAENGTVAVDWI